MTDDASRVLSEEERARIHMARNRGGLCGLCGRALAEGEPAWMERIAVHGEHGDLSYWRVPVGAECVSPELRRETEGQAPERCAGCGRGVHYQASDHRRQRALCSKRCSQRYQTARARERRSS